MAYPHPSGTAYPNVFEQPSREQVEELIGWVDPDNEASFLSLYADLTDPRHRHRIEERRDEVLAVLDVERGQAFEAALEEASESLGPAKSRQARGLAVFVSPEEGRARAVALAEPVETRVVWDTSPYIRPLARFVDDYEDIAIVLVDGDRATIHHVQAADPKRVYTGKTNLSSRHRSGGWSQMRYQRTRETELKRFLDDVVERLDRLVREERVQQVIIGGQGAVRDQLANRLPPRLMERLTTVEPVDLDDDTLPELLRRFAELGRLREEQGSREVLDNVLSLLERGELVSANPFEVARAARDGRVEILLVDDDSPPGGAKCEIHGTVFERGSTCPCGSEGTPVDLANEAVEWATRSDARTEFVDDPRLRDLGGLLALLRW